MSEDDQIQNVSTAFCMVLGILNKGRRNSPETMKLIIYNALLELQLRYCR